MSGNAPPLASAERKAINDLAKLTDSAVLRQLLMVYLTGRASPEDLQAGLSIVLAEDPVRAALAFAGARSDNGLLRKLIRYRELWDGERAKFAYIEDDLTASLASTHWLDDARFAAAYARAKSVSAWDRDIRWRMHILTSCAARAAKLNGDFVECGTDRGGSALCAIGYLGRKAFARRTFYLFDTFEGIVTRQLQDEEREREGLDAERYPPVLDAVKQTFAEFAFVRIVPGAIPDTLAEFTGDKVAFLHIDMNVALPEQKALEFFWPRLAKGAPVILDDYGFPRSTVQRRVLDEVAAGFGTTITTLPTGQGLLWR